LSEEFWLESIEKNFSENGTFLNSKLQRVYESATEEEALYELDNLETKWTDKYPQTSRSWRQNWHNLNTLFSYHEGAIRRPIYTTNAIESLYGDIRKAAKKRKYFLMMMQRRR
jgi:putative transposase